MRLDGIVCVVDCRNVRKVSQGETFGFLLGAPVSVWGLLRTDEIVGSGNVGWMIQQLIERPGDGVINECQK